jgi:hypothetical protein
MPAEAAVLWVLRAVAWLRPYVKRTMAETRAAVQEDLARVFARERDIWGSADAYVGPWLAQLHRDAAFSPAAAEALTFVRRHVPDADAALLRITGVERDVECVLGIVSRRSIGERQQVALYLVSLLLEGHGEAALWPILARTGPVPELRWLGDKYTLPNLYPVLLADLRAHIADLGYAAVHRATHGLAESVLGSDLTTLLLGDLRDLVHDEFPEHLEELDALLADEFEDGEDDDD